jgi:TRAP-type C4-dicarboxylate transport system permease large subunit
MGLGLFAPPFGIGYYMGCAIAGVPPEKAMRPVWTYLATIAAGILIIAAVPWITSGLR